MNIRYHVLMDEPEELPVHWGPPMVAPTATPSLTSPASGGLDLTQQTSSLLHPGHGVAGSFCFRSFRPKHLKTKGILTNKKHGSHQI